MPNPPQKMMIIANAPYIHIWVFLETPKVGKKPGRKLSGIVVTDDEGLAVEVGEAEEVVLGFALTGRSIWSLGTEPGTPVSDEPGDKVVVLTIADITSWLSSSCSVGMGRRLC